MKTFFIVIIAALIYISLSGGFELVTDFTILVNNRG